MFKSWLFEVEQPPTRWEYIFSESEITNIFNHFGFSDVTYFKQGAEHFVIYSKEVFSFYSQKIGSDEAKQITGIMNYIQSFIRREPDYIFFFHGGEEIIIEKTSLEVFLEEKPPTCFPAWHIFYRVPHGKTEIALTDLPECNLLF